MAIKRGPGRPPKQSDLAGQRTIRLYARQDRILREIAAISTHGDFAEALRDVLDELDLEGLLKNLDGATGRFSGKVRILPHK